MEITMATNRGGSPTQKNTPAYYRSCFNSARSNLLTMLAFSTINLILLIIQANTYFLFSSFFSYNVALFGQYLSYYLNIPAIFIVALILSVIWLLLFLLCWLFSKKRPGWLTFAAVLFGLDCVFLLLSFTIFEFDLSVILDVVFHVAVMVYLVRGVDAAKKLKKMPSIPAYDPSLIQNRIPLYPMAPDEEARVLVQCLYNGHVVLVRTTQETTEFVANGMVYAILVPGQTSCDILVGDTPFHFAAENGLYTLSVQGYIIGQAASAAPQMPIQ